MAIRLVAMGLVAVIQGEGVARGEGHTVWMRERRRSPFASTGMRSMLPIACWAFGVGLCRTPFVGTVFVVRPWISLKDAGFYDTLCDPTFWAFGLPLDAC